MPRRVLAVLLGTLLLVPPAQAQQRTVTGLVTNEAGTPVQGVQVILQGTNLSTTSGREGRYSINASPGQVLLFRLIGYAPASRTVGTEAAINVQLTAQATRLDELVVTALGQTTVQRTLGSSQQAVEGTDIAQTSRENFVNSLAGRVSGVEVTSSSGVPGASTQITIRGIGSISSSNQPLMIVDGLPIDNKTMNTGVFASDANSTTAFNNRGLDFTNRAADINPHDIESMVVLKGPEAAALYGIDAANGAIVITTKRGKAGTSGFEYNVLFRMDKLRDPPTTQSVYGPTSVSGDLLGGFVYFGAKYAPGTVFYDNVDGFFQSAVSQQHQLSFSGATQDGNINYRLATGFDKQEGVIPSSVYKRVNLTGASQAQITSWLRTDLSIQYAMTDNDQPYKGANGPLLGLLLWPHTDDAKNYLTPAGTRRQITSQAASTETDNPYFNVDKNAINQNTSRLIANVGLAITPFSWGRLKSNIGVDAYTSANEVLRHPESIYGVNNNGILDEADDVTRNLTVQTVFNVNPQRIAGGWSVSGLLGNTVTDLQSTTSALGGTDFLDPNFVSMNNTSLRTNKTTVAQRRLVGLYGQVQVDYNDYLYLTLTGRNDWTSTIPEDRNSFFYPGASVAFMFSDAFPSVAKYVTGKLRASYVQAGQDARPYAYRPVLEYKTTAYGGYGYGFYGPNLALAPEFTKSYEVGAELGFLDNRVGLDLTYWEKRKEDQITNDLRGSYATGFILFNLNGATTKGSGWEATLRATPVLQRNFSWDVMANFDRTRNKTVSLPNDAPESYVSDTWLYGNVRNGTAPGLSTRSLMGQFYLRNNAGQLLIDPASGLPLRSTPFVDGGYDRQPDWNLGLSNVFRYKDFTLSVLVDFRKGGDVFNATEHLLVSRGLSPRTLDREEPRVVEGVLRDGKENSDTPTKNTIVVIPAVQTGYYTAMSEELFIEKDINWFRLRDLTFRWNLPGRYLGAREASVYLTGTDLLLITNYSGLDPIVNGNTAAVGGSGGAGIDYGNFPMPRGFSFGLQVRF